MNAKDAREQLNRAGLAVTEEKRLGNETGTTLRLDNGAIVNLFDNGTVNFQGKNQNQAREALGLAAEGGVVAQTVATPSSKVFVVYGHDTTARNELEAMLRRWGLDPLILDQLPSEGQTIIEKLEQYMAEVSFAVILATPDDEGHRAGRDDERAYRARQNVVLELGMMLALLGRKRVAILVKQMDNMERPSDIQGLIYIPFKDNLQKDAGPLLAKEMAAQGYDISVKKL